MIDGRAVRVRDAGDRDGSPIVYFHGTPGSRLDVCFGDDAAARAGVRVISFDRPGYGGSTPAAYDLESVAGDAEQVATSLGVDEFATFGWSGGGPFALATAAYVGHRVTAVGVAGGLAPPQDMPGGTDAFTQEDRNALSFLPDDPSRAASAFHDANEATLELLLSARSDAAAPWIDWMWGQTDPAVVADPALRAALRTVLDEGLRQGPIGICWDNVAWGGPWGFALDDVQVPAHLWYGEDDQMVPPANGQWLAAQLPQATLTTYAGEGHLVPMRHWSEMVRALTA